MNPNDELKYKTNKAIELNKIEEKINVCCVRVSTHSKKNDLEHHHLTIL